MNLESSNGGKKYQEFKKDANAVLSLVSLSNWGFNCTCTVCRGLVNADFHFALNLKLLFLCLNNKHKWINIEWYYCLFDICQQAYSPLQYLLYLIHNKIHSRQYKTKLILSLVSESKGYLYQSELMRKSQVKFGISFLSLLSFDWRHFYVLKTHQKMFVDSLNLAREIRYYVWEQWKE